MRAVQMCLNDANVGLGDAGHPNPKGCCGQIGMLLAVRWASVTPVVLHCSLLVPSQNSGSALTW